MGNIIKLPRLFVCEKMGFLIKFRRKFNLNKGKNVSKISFKFLIESQIFGFEQYSLNFNLVSKNFDRAEISNVTFRSTLRNVEQFFFTFNRYENALHLK